jgi:hypothetical protein
MKSDLIGSESEAITRLYAELGNLRTRVQKLEHPAQPPHVASDELVRLQQVNHELERVNKALEHDNRRLATDNQRMRVQLGDITHIIRDQREPSKTVL